MPHKTWSIGEQVIQTDFQPNVADQVVAVFANAASRASGWPAPPVGAMSYLQDAPGVLWTFYAGGWHAPTALGMLTYLDVPTDINIPASTSIDLPGMATTFTPAGPNRRIKATANCQFGVTQNTPAALVSLALTDGANAVIKDRSAGCFSSTTQSLGVAVSLTYAVTIGPVATSWKLRVANQTPGATAIYAQDYNLLVEDIGGA